MHFSTCTLVSWVNSSSTLHKKFMNVFLTPNSANLFLVSIDISISLCKYSKKNYNKDGNIKKIMKNELSQVVKKENALR
jgi:hypothetical protein